MIAAHLEAVAQRDALGGVRGWSQSEQSRQARNRDP